MQAIRFTVTIKPGLCPKMQAIQIYGNNQAGIVLENAGDPDLRKQSSRGCARKCRQFNISETILRTKFLYSHFY
jgi:hypothetical protein